MAQNGRIREVLCPVMAQNGENKGGFKPVSGLERGE